MAMELKFLILLASSTLLFLPLLSANPAIDFWCKQAPYKEVCEHFLSKNPSNYLSKKDFKKLSIKIALERAVAAGENNKHLGSKCRNEKEKAAWTDCLKLYESTIQLLNKTADPNTHCTDYDTQTWLSTALTNLETCRSGFIELGVPNFLPFITNDVSKLICNGLSLGNSSLNHETNYYDGGFPTWFSPRNRKLLQATNVRPNVVVAQDGSGNFRTIKAAIDAAAARSGSGRFVIRIRRGVYRENLEISGARLRNIMFVGDGIKNTIITGSRSVGGGSTTFNSATVIVTGDGFIARDITFRNTAGPQNNQAVALRSGADLSVFYKCGFEGYQDTLYVHSQRQFYKECYIFGTIDFIFGNAAVVLQNCMIYPRLPMSRQKNVITAQGRSDPNQNTGISIHNSVVLPAADLVPSLSTVQTFLGRPWREYSRTVFMQTHLGSLVDPAGWLEWSGNFALNTLYYGEYRNSGPGSGTSRRVRWRGYRVITNPAEANRFTAGNFLAARSWLPATGVPFTPGL